MKYTPRAERVIQLAVREAELLGHPSAGSQHLVLGLLCLGTGLQFTALKNMGLAIDSAKERVRSMGPHFEKTKRIEGTKLGLSAAAALKKAANEAQNLGPSYTGTEHILLALLTEETGGAVDLFASYGVDVVQSHEALLKDLYRVIEQLHRWRQGLPPPDDSRSS